MRNLAATLLAAGCLGCGGGGGGGSSGAPEGGPDLGNGIVYFHFTPLFVDNIGSITPLGNLNPPDHTIPTDHMYFYFDASPGDLSVYAPAGGYVLDVFQPGSDYKALVKCTNTFYYYLDHIIPAAGIVKGVTIQANQVIGTASNTAGIDFGVVNTDITLGFLTPVRYHWQTLHAASPLAYYQDEPLRSILLDKVQRLGAEKDGKIDFDQAGKLIGNWFLEGVPIDQSEMPANWDKQIAFVWDVYNPAIFRISIGGQLTKVGEYAASTPDLDPENVKSPATVTPASGKVTYRLHNRGALLETPYYSIQEGLLIVQMLDENRIKVEAFDDHVSSTATFTGAARIYIR